MEGCTRKKICIHFDKSNASLLKNCVVHSRYHTGSKVNEWNQPLKVATPTRAMRSAYPLRENIWEYLHGDKYVRNSICKRRTRVRRNETSEKAAADNDIIWLLVMILLACFMILNSDPSVEEECCYVMKTLSASVLRAEQALRNTQRIRRLMIIKSQASKSDKAQQEKNYIEDATVTPGGDTVPWTSRVALWGVLPLWRTSPPPRTVLAKRTPVPSDCWPFSGSRGELVIQLQQQTEVRSIAIEHVRPDTAKSAPKNFVLFGILENGTLVKSLEAEYSNQGPAKQLFKVASISPLQKVVLRVMSNQGNTKYTCVYRIYLYRKL